MKINFILGSALLLSQPLCAQNEEVKDTLTTQMMMQNLPEVFVKATRPIAHVLIIVKLLYPRIRIIQDLLTECLLRRGIFFFRSKERANHLLFSDKEMSTMVMKRIHRWEGTLTVRNQKISRNPGIGVDIKGDFLRLISVSLFLAQYFHIPSRSRFRRRHHAFKHLRPCRLLPLLEVLNRTVSPRIYYQDLRPCWHP